MIISIPVTDNNPLTPVRDFLRSLMEAGIIDALYVSMESPAVTRNGSAIIPALVTDPERLSYANPLAPVMPINSARAVSALTGRGSPQRLGAVLRPCELRALVELVKLQQASLEGVTLIGIDCPGTCEVLEYNSMQQNGGFDLLDFLGAASRGEISAQQGQVPLRPACQMCAQPVPTQADIHLYYFGIDSGSHMLVQIDDGLAVDLDFQQADAELLSKSRAVVEKLVAGRQEVRQRELASMQSQLSSDGSLVDLLASCIRCHNCMTACPICYCKTCLFRTRAFDHAPEHYYLVARHKGALRMLDDTLLFHITRLNHMSASCVSCGMCTSACPMDIPVGLLFSAVGTQVQQAFEYEPGLDVDDTLPLVTFQADEWLEVGEAK